MSLLVYHNSEPPT